ncbi:MAG: cupin domain-containing protein [Tardiphaga sp.]
MPTNLAVKALNSDAELAASNARLGIQVRHLRLVKGLRLKDLADLCGCSESMISKIENNKTAPSLNTIHRIAKALGTSVAELLQDRASGGRVVTRAHERQIIQEAGSGVSGGTEAEVMIPFGASAMLQAFLIRLSPGAGSGGNLQHDGEEVGFVRSGQLSLTVSGTTYLLREGDSFFFSSTALHSFFNPGEAVTEVVWVNTPPSL